MYPWEFAWLVPTACTRGVIIIQQKDDESGMPPEIVGAAGGDQSPGGDTFVIDDVEMWGEDDGIEYMVHGSRHEPVVQSSPAASPRELGDLLGEQGDPTGGEVLAEAPPVDFWSNRGDGLDLSPPVFGGNDSSRNVDLSKALD